TETPPQESAHSSPGAPGYVPAPGRDRASGIGSCMTGQALPALLLVPLPDAQSPLAALLGRKLRRAVLPGGGEAKLDRVPVELVNPELGLPPGRAFRHGVVDGLGLLGRVDAELGPEIDLPAEGDRCLAVLRHPLTA